MCLAENKKKALHGYFWRWTAILLSHTQCSGHCLCFLTSLQQERKHMDMMNTRTSRRPAPSMDQVWQRLPGHPTVVCVSAAHGTYWGSKTSLMRARRSLSESTLASWCTSRDVVSESSRKLKSLHSTGKENTTKNVTTRRQNEHRTCDWWNSHRYGHLPFWLRTRETKGGRI